MHILFLFLLADSMGILFLFSAYYKILSNNPKYSFINFNQKLINLFNILILFLSKY